MRWPSSRRNCCEPRGAAFFAPLPEVTIRAMKIRVGAHWRQLDEPAECDEMYAEKTFESDALPLVGEQLQLDGFFVTIQSRSFSYNTEDGFDVFLWACTIIPSDKTVRQWRNRLLGTGWEVSDCSWSTPHPDRFPLHPPSSCG